MAPGTHRRDSVAVTVGRCRQTRTVVNQRSCDTPSRYTHALVLLAAAARPRASSQLTYAPTPRAPLAAPAPLPLHQLATFAAASRAPVSVPGRELRAGCAAPRRRSLPFQSVEKPAPP